jgi:hypothetical protein
MAITYTDNFNFPLPSDTTENWGAIFNGIMAKIDLELKAAQSIIVNRSGSVITCFRLGEVITRRYQL